MAAPALRGDSLSFVDAYTAAEDEYVARVPAGLTSQESLYDSLFESLGFPDYFGFNFNALWDCLCDFSWMEQRTIALIHEDVPALPIVELGTYLEILDDAVAQWKTLENHSLRVVFPASSEEAVRFLLRRKPPREIER